MFFYCVDPLALHNRRDEYSVTISSQKLGMTVENVLERTVVRAAAPGGGAEAAGVETGSLLVALDGQSTKVKILSPSAPLEGSCHPCPWLNAFIYLIRIYDGCCSKVPKWVAP